jgi:DNA-binding response OmpR family regulator
MDETVLIVEDDEKLCKMLSFLFMSKGIKVKIAHNGIEALKSLEEERPDSIILDIMMPKMDGFEFCSKIKKESSLREIPVIALSALPSSLNEGKMLSLGAADYITKPFKAEDVMNRVLSAMEMHSHKHRI